MTELRWQPTLLLLALVACGYEPSAAADQTPSAPVPAVQARPQVFSIYTSLMSRDCRLIERIEEGASMRERCPGVAGLTLEAGEGDGREDLAVVRDGSVESLELMATGGSGGFSNLGERAEWRGPAIDPFMPRTLTVRYNVSENPDDVNRQTSYLVVARLAPSACVIAVVPPGPGQSDRARAVADAAALPPCLGGPR